MLPAIQILVVNEESWEAGEATLYLKSFLSINTALALGAHAILSTTLSSP
jgi:hypothetical protein